jgi:UDP-N-acetylglucosamine 1-carboxyvinyltransferase
MSKIIVRGGRTLTGTVRVHGAKNSVLPILAAALLAEKGSNVIHDVPDLDDVKNILQVLSALGVYSQQSDGSVRLQAESLISCEAP